MYQQKTKAETKQVETRICETCGREFVMGYGYSIYAMWAVTGHAWVKGYECSETGGGSAQHWGCTPEHALEAVTACLQGKEHLGIEGLKEKHAASGKDRIAQEDQWILDAYPNFPYVD